MKRILTLLLVLAALAGLCACQAGAPAPELDGGTWTEVADRTFRPSDYAADWTVRVIPENWVLPADLPLGGDTRTEVREDLLLHGLRQGSLLPGFTVYRYKGEGKLETAYTLSEGVAPAWQPFFNGDGTRLAFPWMPSAQAEAWSLRVADLASGTTRDLTLPEGAGERDFLLCAWQEDGSLLVTSVNMGYDFDEDPPVTWVYTFPGQEEPSTE